MTATPAAHRVPGALLAVLVFAICFVAMASDAQALRLSSRPAAVNRPGTNVEDVAVRGVDNHIWLRTFDGQNWGSWVDLGGQFQGQPALVSFGSNHLDVLARDASNHLEHRYFNGSAWSAWETIDPSWVIAGDPKVASWSNGREDVFARGGDGTLSHAVYTNGAWVPHMESLGGSMIQDPNPVSMGWAHLDIFTLDPQGHLQHRYYTASGGWSGWLRLSDWQFTTTPSTATWSDGGSNQVMNVFTIGLDGALVDNHWYAPYGWYQNASLGGTLVGAASAVSMGVGTMDVFARWSNNKLFNYWYNPQTGWQTRTLGDWQLATDPTAIGWPGHEDVFAIGTDGQLIHRWFDGTWHEWSSLGAPSPYPTSDQYGGADGSINTAAEIAAVMAYLSSASDDNANAAWAGMLPADDARVYTAIMAEPTSETCSTAASAIGLCTGAINANEDEPLATAAGHSLCPRYAAYSPATEEVIPGPGSEQYPAIWRFQQSWKRYQNGVAGNQKILNIVNHSSRATFNGRSPTFISESRMTCGNDLLYRSVAYVTEYFDRSGSKRRQYRLYETDGNGSMGTGPVPKTLPPLTGSRYGIQFKFWIKYPAEVNWWLGPKPETNTISCGEHGTVDTCWYEA